MNIDKAILIFAHRTYRVTFVNFAYSIRKLMENNIRFDSDIKYGEDNLFLWKYVSSLMEEATEIYVIGTPPFCTFTMITTHQQ